MHPLPAAQATAASLHALLPRHESSTRDEQLVIDAIIALRRWAFPHQSPVPTRLRIRPSLSLRIRVKAPSEVAPTINRGKHRNLRVRRAHRSPNAELGLSQRFRHSEAVELSSARDTVCEGDSHLRSLSHPDSQMVNFSDRNTEPPQGWPKLSDPSSSGLDQAAKVIGSEKHLDKYGNLSETPIDLKKHKGRVDARSRAKNRQSTEVKSKNGSLSRSIVAASPTRRVAKRRRVSPTTSDEPEDTELAGLQHGATSSSATDADCRPHSPNTKEAEGKDQDYVQRAGARKKRASVRKSSVPKRHRSTSQNQSLESPLTNECESKASRLTTGPTESPQGFANESPKPTDSTKGARCGHSTESPPISVTQKSGEQDRESHSQKSSEPAHSFGSVIVGSSSYDGCSVDFGYDMTPAKRDDASRRPSSVVWNERNAESIEEPRESDHSVVPFDSIEETERVPDSELRESTNNSNHPDSFPDGDISNALPQVSKKRDLAHKGSFRENDITSSKRHKGPTRPFPISESMNSSITSPSLHPEKCVDPPNTKILSPTKSGGNASDIGRQSPTHLLPSRISPVTLAAPSAAGENNIKDITQEGKPVPSSETNIGEMVVCVASFKKESESELAHELVMRLGGEIVSDFENRQPECVVAPVDPETKEVIGQEMTTLMALASRVPVVGLSWLTHCFKSGCWADLKDFETPSSRLRPSSVVFGGVIATFEDAFFCKNVKKQYREYRNDIKTLLELAGGAVVEKSKILGVIQSDNRIRLHLQIAYDFGNSSMNPAPQEVPDLRVPTHVASKHWITTCLISGQCPPPGSKVDSRSG